MKLPFDKNFIIHCSHNHERYDFINQWTNDYNINSQIDIWWTCKRNITYKIGKLIDTVQTYDYKLLNNDKVFGNVFDCSFQHFSIIKTSYERGLESIMIMEDDFGFCASKETLSDIFNNLPEDWDIIKLDTILINRDYKDNGAYFDECYDENVKFGTMCYALNRNGMKAVIDVYENEFIPSDMALYRAISSKNVKTYISNYRIGFCFPSKSSIETT